MKKLTLILVTILMVATGSLYAQSHRHTDRSNTAAVESIANISAADTCQVEEVYGEFLSDEDINLGHIGHDFSESGESVAKVAIIAVFSCLALVILIPILVIALIIYLVVRNNNKNKGYPTNNYTAASSNATVNSNATTESDAAPAPAAPASKPVEQKTKMERGLKKTAVGAGFIAFGLWCHMDFFTALGLGFLVYGIGLVCIDIFVDKKE